MKNQLLKMAVLSAAAGLGLAFGHQANAAVVYSYVSGQPTYTVDAGSQVVVNLYLKEGLDGGSSSFIASDNGLAGFGLTVTRTSPASSAASIANASIDTTDFPTFPTVASAPDTATIASAISLTATTGILPPNTGGGSAPAIDHEIFLGSVTVIGGSSPTTFSVGSIDPINGGNTITKSQNVWDLDTGVDGPGDSTTAFTPVGSTLTTFTVAPAAVPEPGSIAMLACGGLLALRRRRA